MKKGWLFMIGVLMFTSCSYTVVVNKSQKLAVTKGDIEVNKGGNIITLTDMNFSKIEGSLKKGDNIKVSGKKVKRCK